jgi:DNA-binding transcriptional LysR family regulator
MKAIYDCRPVDTRLLEYFVTVADELSVTESARQLYAAQSTVSAGLRSLERDLGVRLFERTTKSVALTPAGEELLDEAREILEGISRLHTLAGQSAKGQRGRVRIGTFASQDVNYNLPAALREFRDAYPNVDVRLVDAREGSTGLTDDLLRGRLDIAFFALPAPAALETIELIQEPYVALVAASHPLASRPSVSLAELADESWVSAPPGFGSRIQIERALAERGLSRRVVAEIGSVPAIPAYVAAGIGVAVVPPIVDPTGCAVLQLTDSIPPWTLSLATRRQATSRPLVAALIDVLRAHVSRWRPTPAIGLGGMPE